MDTAGMSTKTKRYLFDSHKLLYHLDRVLAWQRGERIIPIHIDVSPAGLCNQACIYCLFAYQAERMRRERWILPREILLGVIRDAARLGVRSIALIGDGEPFMNRHTPDAITLASDLGVDIAVATNGVLLRPESLPNILRALTWMRFSFCAARPESYAHVQGTRPEDFARALRSMEASARIKHEEGLAVDIGAVFLLLPQNREDLLGAVRIVRDAGLDYIYIKQYVAIGENDFGFDFSFYAECEDLLREAESMSTESFHVVARWQNILKRDKGYDRCLGLPFLVHVGGNGKLYPCAPLIGHDDVCYGNLHESSLEEILSGEAMRAVVEGIAREREVRRCCPSTCRQDYLNSFLWQISHPPAHVNFI